MTHATIYVQCMYRAHTFKMKLCNCYIHVHVLDREEFNISITRITRVNNICFCLVFLHMLTCFMRGCGYARLGIMVADFCSLVILIHNTLLGEIMISST